MVSSGKGGNGSILRELGSFQDLPTRPQTARELIGDFVQIRNKTKAHGAVGPDFFAVANEPYISAVQLLLVQCPLFSWDWLHLTVGRQGQRQGDSSPRRGPSTYS